MHTNYNINFTLDYEIHGNGDGNPVEPTYRLMDLLEEYSAKLTIFPDVAEILCFKKYYEIYKEDKFHYLDIEKQLKNAIQRGHDVQLHIHSSYFKSNFYGMHWDQCIEEYSMASLAYERIEEMIKECLEFLHTILRTVKPSYTCLVFRAANWSMMPTKNIYNALINNGIKIDTSVYKGGCEGGNVSYDYRCAHSNLFSYTASEIDINIHDPQGIITEYPIYTEMRRFWSFITPLRIFRMLRAKLHKHKKSGITTEVSKVANTYDNRNITIRSFFNKSPWKFDFNQASGTQMINALKRVMKTQTDRKIVDVILIGHSKTFIQYNHVTLNRFLKFASKQKNVTFGLFSR